MWPDAITPDPIMRGILNWHRHCGRYTERELLRRYDAAGGAVPGRATDGAAAGRATGGPAARTVTGGPAGLGAGASSAILRTLERLR